MSRADADMTAGSGGSARPARGPLGRALDRLYAFSMALAAVAMIGLLAMVLLSIVSRQFSFLVPGTDAYAGYLMAAAGFLALAGTLKRGEHIRVTLLLNAVKGRPHQWMERIAHVAGVLLAGLGAWFAVRLVMQSLDFNDISTANDATPLWIPQLAMAFGSIVLLIAMLDELLLEWRGLRPEPTPGARAEAAHVE